MIVQEYVLHLANGDTIVASEPYELEGPKTILSRFVASRTRPNMWISIKDMICGTAYIPWSSVVYIHTGRVVEADNITEMYWKLNGINQMEDDKKRKDGGDKTNDREK